jgi:hypothetical protein
LIGLVAAQIVVPALLAVILGRLEIIAVFALFNPFYWRS